jgi:hypothetical protein
MLTFGYSDASGTTDEIDVILVQLTDLRLTFGQSVKVSATQLTSVMSDGGQLLLCSG